MINLSQNVLVFFGLLCFSISLFVPAFYTSGDDFYGYWVLITGWIGLVFLQLSWYANPLNLLALLLFYEKPKMALILSVFALILASGAFGFYEIPTGINHEKVFIKEFGFGLYLWYTAQICIVAALFLRLIESLRA